MKAGQSYDCIAREYARQFHGELAHKSLDREMLERFAEAAAEAGSSSPPLVLDVGCGPGHISQFLADCGLAPIGIDLSHGMIAEARRLNPGIDFRVGDLRALGWLDSTIAGLVAPYSIIHIPRSDVPTVLRDFHRILIPGGPLLISYHVGSEVVHRDQWWDEPVDLDFTFFEVAEMEGYLHRAGFTDIETFQRDPYPEVEAQTRRAYAFCRS